MTKVSVIIATYRSGDGLDRLVDSLDTQSFPTDAWEAIFIDDGSPDDTFERLTEIASTRPNFRIGRIENSGWPCRPRNTGIEMARGEYVAFMDHDDELYPDALRDGYAFATAHRADVLNGKEARTHDAGWAIEQYVSDIPQVLGAGLPFGALKPTNPHKMYRRAFLNEHGIRFREGGRVLWEDIFFNVAALRHAQVVSTMASTPYYHWYTTKGSGSTTFRRARPEWWHWLNEVIVAIDQDLASDELARERDLLRLHQYSDRLIESFNGYYVKRKSDVRKSIFEQARRLQAMHFSEADDSCLDVTWKLRAQLLRAGHPHALDRLIRDDPALTAHPKVTELSWKGGRLHVGFEVDWRDAEGGRYAIHAKNGRVYKTLSDPLNSLFLEEQLDVTEEIDSAKVAISVRSARSRIAWLAESESHAWRSEDQFVDFGVNGMAIIDPSSAALGRPLEPGIWDLTARCILASGVHQPHLRGEVAPALRIGASGASAAYARADGKMILDLAPEDIAALVRPSGRIRTEGSRVALELDVDEIEPGAEGLSTLISLRTGSGGLRGHLRSLLVRKSDAASGWQLQAARIRILDGTAWLEFDAVGTVLIRLGAYFPGGAEIYQASRNAVRRLSGWRKRLV